MTQTARHSSIPHTRRILRQAIPTSLANLVQQSYVLVDSAVVGHFVGSHGLAAIGAAGVLYFLYISVFGGIASGFSVKISHAAGASAQRKMSAQIVGFIAVTGVWTTLSAAFTWALTRPVIELVGVQPSVADAAVQYLHILSAGFLPIFILAAFATICRSTGRPGEAVMYLIAASASNALFCIALVPFLGFVGAPLASVTSSWIVVMAVAIRYRQVIVKHFAIVRTLGWPVFRAEVTNAVRLGIPLGSQFFFIAVGSGFLTSVIARLGTDVLAAFAVGSRIEGVMTRLPLDISGAVSMLSAHAIGQGDTDLARSRLVRSGLWLELAIGLIGGGVLICFADPIARIFTAGHTAAILSNYLAFVYLYFWTYCLMVVFHGFFNAHGRTLVPFACTIISFCIVRLLAAYLLSSRFGYMGAAWAIALGWGAGLVFTIGWAWWAQATQRIPSVLARIKI